MPDATTITDALRAAQARGQMPTTLGTAELRAMGEDVLAGSVFTARGASAIYVSKIDEVVRAIAAGDMDEATARVTLLETLRALGYTPEGGFPDTPPGTVPPAIAGSLQDLGSYRRLQLIVDTQRSLMRGKGFLMRGSDPARVAAYPAWELIRVIDAAVPRDWPSRWLTCGGRLVDGGRMIALKGDPIWAELGSYQIFDDALGVDHPPFAFNSGMDWEEKSLDEVRRLGITGPDGESLEAFFAQGPITTAGTLRLPPPVISTRDMTPAVTDAFVASTGSTIVDGAATPTDRAAELRARMKARLDNAIQRSRDKDAQ